MRSISCIDSLKGWIVGDSGIILHSSNGGVTWLKQISNTTNSLNSVSFCDSLIGWAVGFGGTKLKTVDGGITWNRVLHDTANNINNTKVKCFDQNNVLVSRIAWYGDYYGGGVLWNWKSDSMGTGWQNISPYSGSGLIFTIIDFDFVTKNVGWVIKMDGLNYNWVSQVSKTINGGTTWESNQIPSTGYISFSDNSTGLLINSGYIFAYVDSINSFMQIDSIEIYYGGGSICQIGNVSYASSNSSIMKSTNNGKQWVKQSNGGTTISDIEFVTPDIGWAVGNNGFILHTTNGGLTSVQYSQHMNNDFNLCQNYPNPFNPTTTISFSLKSKSFVSLKIFDLIGREVSTLVDGQLSEGMYTRQWNAINEPSGVYFYRLQAGSFMDAKKLILLR